MARLIVHVLFEIIVGISLAGVVAGLVVPVLDRGRMFEPGGVSAGTVVAVILLGGIALMLGRPGSALRRSRRR